MSLHSYASRLFSPFYSLAALGLGAAPLAAQASYELYGQGCNGATPSSCLSLNDTNPSLQVSSLPNEYAYPVINTTGQAIQVIGFDVYTRTNTVPTDTVKSGLIWDLSGPSATVHTRPDPTLVANGTMTVTLTAGWYSTTVYPPITVPNGVAFWFMLEAYSRVAPPQHVTGGLAGPTTNWYRRPSNGMVWTSSVSVARQIFRIRCVSDAPSVPYLLASAPPVLGQQVNFTIGGGSPFSMGFFLIGLDGSQWLTLPTPVDLGIVGAPTCSIYSSSDYSIGVPLDGVGQVLLPVTIPNFPALSGFPFFNQAAAISIGANALNVLFSNAGRGVIG